MAVEELAACTSSFLRDSEDARPESLSHCSCFIFGELSEIETQAFMFYFLEDQISLLVFALWFAWAFLELYLRDCGGVLDLLSLCEMKSLPVTVVVDEDAAWVI